MSEKTRKIRRISVLIGKNALRFVFNLAIAFAYQILFGMENILIGVVFGVALTMYPAMDLGVRKLPMLGSLFGLFLGAGLVAQLALLSPWLALPCNLLFVAAIMLLCTEPVHSRPSICFLLCFVFCQATPVPWDRLPVRLLSLAVGALATCAACLVWWKRKGYPSQARTLRQQVGLCARNPGLVLRMAVGIAVAMLIGMLLQLKKPLWISIVVMSLTQLDFAETFQRIKHRAIGTVCGAVLFLVLFRVLIPEQYAGVAILAIGYISFFIPEYKYKQVVNAINALNASLVLLDTFTAIENRVLCLLAGIAIVLLLCLLQKLAERLTVCRRPPLAGQTDERVLPEETALGSGALQ